MLSGFLEETSLLSTVTVLLTAAGRLGEGESFGLPYGILVPKGYKNLWVAGRCTSSDQWVHGSIRVMPACGMMGQAAATAASRQTESAM